MKSTKKAYAKINLYLDVMAKREDGYHDIKSVMLQVGLYDEVTVERDGGVDIRLLDLCGELPDGEENIAYRCADAFLRYYDLREGVTIRLKKRIPIAAGLGGGSSDGAAVLSAMAECDRSGARRGRRIDTPGISTAGQAVRGCARVGFRRFRRIPCLSCPRRSIAAAYAQHL